MATPLYVAVALTVYLLVAAIWDLYTLRVPNWLTLPPLAGVLAWRLLRLDLRFVPFWGGCLVAWLVNALAGGDVKLLMALFGFFPQAELFYVLLVVAGVVLAVVLICRYARVHSLKVFFRRVAYRLSTLQFFPSREELEMDGEPFTFLISLAGIIYVWVLGGAI